MRPSFLGIFRRLFVSREPRAFPRLLAASALIVSFAACRADADIPDPSLLARINGVFSRWDRPDSPGLVLGVARNGRTLILRGYGMENLEEGVRLDSGTVSESGSVAKQVTAAAVALLSVRGKLALDDNVRTYLPEVPDFGRPITLRMLLNHTSGLRDIHTLFWLQGRPSYTAQHENAEVLEVVGHQRDLNFPPGSAYLYSNTGYILLTLVVERVTGQEFGRFCSENLFVPHGMPHASWRRPFDRIVARRAVAYARRPDGTFVADMPHSNVIGNGGVLATVGEWLAWNEALDSAEGEWSAVVRLLETPSKLSDGSPIGYGLGLSLGSYKGLREVSHGGATSGYRTYLARFPDRHLSIAILGNSDDLNTGKLAHEVADIVLDLPADKDPARYPVPRHLLESRVGYYRMVGGSGSVHIASVDGTLSADGRLLYAVSESTLVPASGTPAYSFDALPGVRGWRLAVSGASGTETYERLKDAAPSPAELSAYEGSYHSVELDVTIPVSVEGGRLLIRVRPAPASVANPTVEDVFVAPGLENGTFRFKRGADGRVGGFEFTSGDGRCRRIAFERL